MKTHDHYTCIVQNIGGENQDNPLESPGLNVSLGISDAITSKLPPISTSGIPLHRETHLEMIMIQMQYNGDLVFKSPL